MSLTLSGESLCVPIFSGALLRDHLLTQHVTNRNC
uniref:Uncharacterized protein n=1 Tax=Anguilla anguilla TaxID=7936 RepID=A0A0E9WIS2_ANGAN